MTKMTCCFTGHRLIPKAQLPGILQRLNAQVDAAIAQGTDTFISGGALGFDQLAALVVLNKRDDEHQPVRLIIAQPCRDQSKGWRAKEQQLYQSILNRADQVVCLSERYFNGCMQMRNRYMVDHADQVIACMERLQGGTAQTVNYALKKGLDITNVWE